jgi:hypothetical protein
MSGSSAATATGDTVRLAGFGPHFSDPRLGITAFRNINEAGFRRTILVLLLLSGASLALA